jgi:hypothetical protein
MATNAEHLNLAMQRLGSRSSPTLRAWMLQEMNRAIMELERGATKPWFMEGRLEGTVTANQDYMEIPATFLEEVERGNFRMYNTACLKWVPLVKKDYDWIQNKSENCEAAFPCYYALRGTRIYFAAKPDAAYEYRWEAMIRAGTFADTSIEATNPWLMEFPDLISLIAADKVLRLHVKAFDMADALKPALDQARDSFWREVEHRQEVNRDYGQEPEE